ITSYVAGYDGFTGGVLTSFFAFGGASNGVYVAAGDISGDGRADILVGSGAGVPGGVQVLLGDNGALLGPLYPFGPGYVGGVTVASGDVNGDGVDDIALGTATGAANIEVFAGRTIALLANFQAFGGGTHGVNLALADLNGDGRADLVAGAGAGGLAQVTAYDLNRRGLAFANFVLTDPQAPQTLTGVSGQEGVRVGAV